MVAVEVPPRPGTVVDARKVPDQVMGDAAVMGHQSPQEPRYDHDHRQDADQEAPAAPVAPESR